MHHLFLRKKDLSETITSYTYVFGDQGFSPANQIMTRLFREMLLSVEDGLDELEVEYVDIKMAKEMGLTKAKSILGLLGATPENIRMNKREDVVLSRSFRTAISPGALDYFKQLKDLEELSAYRLFSCGQVKLEVYFAKTMSAFVNADEEKSLFQRLQAERLRYKIIG